MCTVGWIILAEMERTIMTENEGGRWMSPVRAPPSSLGNVPIKSAFVQHADLVSTLSLQTFTVFKSDIPAVLVINIIYI